MCKNRFFAGILCLLLIILTAGCSEKELKQGADWFEQILFDQTEDASLREGDSHAESYEILQNNIPSFTKKQKTKTKAFERYSELDELGRCGPAFANLCIELMPTTEREPIGAVKPSGWQFAKYPGIVEGNYLYNRCHLIGYQLAGENANERNLITGTRHLNVEGMLPFENQVAEYVKESGHHVLYRVTPVFYGDNLVADGVEMEAYSVEDQGEGICFHVFVYNEQPGITIDYSTGDNWLSEPEATRE